MRCFLRQLIPHRDAQLEFIGVKDGQEVMQCPSCRLVACSTETQDEYLKLYKEAGRYFDLVGADYDSFEARFKHDFAVSEARFNNLLEYVHGAERALLDVGTGNGALLLRAIEAGYDCHGADLSQWVLDRARYLVPLATLHTGDILDLPFSLKFDIITFIDVFEHFLDPLASAKRVNELLSSAGLVVVETPDTACDGWVHDGLKWPHCKPLEHPFLYAAAHIKAIFGTIGMKLVGKVYTIPGRCTYYFRRGG